MPWNIDDVEKHFKGLSDDEKKTWVKVANGALESCIDDGGKEKSCEKKAIKIANDAINKSRDDAEDSTNEELDLSVDDLMQTVFRSFFEDYFMDGFFIQEAFIEHSRLGTCIIAKQGSRLYHVPILLEGGSVELADDGDWKRVEVSYDFVKEDEDTADDETEDVPDDATDEANESFAEHASGAAIRLVEKSSGENIVPLSLDVQIIHPGFGNSVDNHYYSAEMLKECAPVFEGAKMYETDHRQDEKSTRTWVSTVKSIEGFTETGAPIGRVIVHDETFAKKILALNEAELLQKMECSIMAYGEAKRGKVEGKKAKIVSKISEVGSVDWVTRAGAGGKALRLAESDVEANIDDESEETDVSENEEKISIREKSTDEKQALDAKIVEAITSRSGLPSIAAHRLSKGEYADVDELEAAIRSEKDYLAEVSGSGKVFKQGGGTAQVKERADYGSRIAEIIQRYTSV